MDLSIGIRLSSLCARCKAIGSAHQGDYSDAHYGYRRVHALLWRRRDGRKDNHKRVYRLYPAAPPKGAGQEGAGADGACGPSAPSTATSLRPPSRAARAHPPPRLRGWPAARQDGSRQGCRCALKCRETGRDNRTSSLASAKRRFTGLTRHAICAPA
ncbi:MAG: hypothetical protein QOK44_2150 [Betaproteobacteria bacterium]|nr:hypothetical protein [Betaproteobacteria bacterium]